nr:hypothetical protein [uncultured Campylobacter sp.]
MRRNKARAKFRRTQRVAQQNRRARRIAKNSLNFVFSKYRGVAVLKASKHKRRRTDGASSEVQS